MPWEFLVIKKLLDALVRATSTLDGKSGCSTRIVWLTAGFAGILAAFIITVVGCVVYIIPPQEADPIYWAAVGALWVNIFAFTSHTKKKDFENECSVFKKEASDGVHDTTTDAPA
jgi:hypothetical protein